ncbi:MAG: DMT family transporter [Promethearchaeota archaeon]|nr:MAG: DMT family transporter [Candidatus Lokiarchaeota archaeon]
MEINQGKVSKNGSFSEEKIKIIAYILLILTTILWGTTFIITKTVIETVPVFFYLTLRFSIALIGFLPFCIFIKKINKKIILMGFISGLLYFAAIATQTLGLKTTTAGKGGFITGLNTIIVPFLGGIFFKETFKKRVWVAAFIAVIGMGFLFLEGEAGIIIGDFLVLICAVFCALFIVYNDKAVKVVNVYLFSIIQIITIILCCFIFSFLLGESYNNIPFVSVGFWAIMIYMGLIVTTFTFIFQNWSQQHVNSANTAIIFALEPVFAALFGFLFGNEILSPLGILGSILILIAIFITVFKQKNNNVD